LFLLSLRRIDLAALVFALVGFVFGLDLLWSLLADSTGSVFYGAIDEPAHLATCAIALLAVLAVAGPRISWRFALAALIASVAIDLDHIPRYLGSHVLTGSLSRPYTHSVLLVIVLVAVGSLVRGGKARQVLFGVAFGVSAHLLRDLATGPGISFLWPLADESIRVPYAAYAAALVLAMSVLLPWRSPAFARGLLMLPLLALVLLAVSPVAASAHRIALGTYIRGTDSSPALLDRYTEEVGRPPAIVGSYKRWDVQPFYRPELEQIDQRGAVPMVGWEPWNAQDRGFRLGAIARGRFDGYVRRSAREAKAWGKPILLRFAQEMNGSWAPWQSGVNGTTGPRFVAAWRHLVRVFDQVGATNVQWVWCPYIDNGSNPFTPFFPGDRWVDWVALDGFNWGAPTAWQSFPKVFDRSYRLITSISSKPLMIAETGSNEAGGSKARWLRRMLTLQLPRLKRVRAVVWFDATDGADFRINSSPSALAAFREGVRSPLYSGGGGWLARRFEGP
jgi:membrane-bound metal-dependent hydrolase YbcI (DUF457 family)